MDYYSCEICGRPGVPGLIIGDFHVIICVQHARAWREHVVRRAEFVALESAKERLRLLEAATASGHYEVDQAYPLAVDLLAVIREQQNILFELACAWIVAQQNSLTTSKT